MASGERPGSERWRRSRRVSLAKIRATGDSGSTTGAQTITDSAAALTVILAVVTSLGVFNTVVLNTRDRRHDLGMLKSIGVTPRQVTVLMVTSMAARGAADDRGGAAQRVVPYHRAHCLHVSR
jgi:putative ABC transport system permease protein